MKSFNEKIEVVTIYWKKIKASIYKKLTFTSTAKFDNSKPLSFMRLYYCYYSILFYSSFQYNSKKKKKLKE